MNKKENKYIDEKEARNRPTELYRFPTKSNFRTFEILQQLEPFLPLS